MRAVIRLPNIPLVSHVTPQSYNHKAARPLQDGINPEVHHARRLATLKILIIISEIIDAPLENRIEGGII